jgi:hypothetical protein
MKNDRVKGNHYSDFGTCVATGKKCLAFEGACRVARGMRRRYDSNHHAYRCTVCGYCHVGSTESPIKSQHSVRSNRRANRCHDHQRDDNQ